jgi:hypothetical protein
MTTNSTSATLPYNTAPDLLAALKDIALLDNNEEAQRIARATIAKAEIATHKSSQRDEKYERQLKIVNHVMEKWDDALRELAK